jgi:hypothetical protein
MTMAGLAFRAAGLAYLANCGLGLGVSTRIIDTTRIHWLHHALYVTTSALTALALSSLVWSRSRAGWWLLPAAVPLAVIPFAGTRTRRHPAIALSAAPFFVLSVARSGR